MALHFLKSWLCCCKDDEEQFSIFNENDETALLIPDNLEPPQYSGNSALVDQHQKLQERLCTIVRAKEGQMVNVGSRIPFNLHNQTLPAESWFNPTQNPNNLNTFDFSLSRSTSRSDLVQSLSHPAHDFISTRSPGGLIPHRHPLFPAHHYPRVFSSFSNSPEPSSRTESPERETGGVSFGGGVTRVNPILNVRLVGFEDQRGRTRERERRCDKARDTDFEPGFVGSDCTVTQSHMPRLTRRDPGSDHDNDTPRPDNLRLQESGKISLSWGD